ncbi:MAG: hypothetical protein R3258_08200, partial [Acidimicrobiia bacterium]|nr:hypothetical protein [Acidimicrobiia bacterium]
VLIDLLQGKAHRSSGGGGVHMTVSLETLAGLSEAPGELDGFAPVAAEVARQVARTLPSSEWTAAVTCSHGEIVHVGTVRRRPSPKVSRHVRAHNPTCAIRGVGCPRSIAISIIVGHGRRVVPHAAANSPRCAGVITVARTKGDGSWSGPTMVTDGPARWATAMSPSVVLPDR